MTDDIRHKRIQSLLARAVALPEEERRAFLVESCQGEPALLEEILGRLDQAARASGPRALDGLDSTALDLDTSRDLPQPGKRIGPYLLLEEIGEGGMGVVYRAEQTAPIRRTVALKLIKAGMDTKLVIARFEAERQALALMDHPNIAKVFDAGSTPNGRPYFVMEYVQGTPIVAFCDQFKLSVPERLGLFMKVCDGVQHAHQKAIIHRDLKPTNVLVTTEAGARVPKIIDFGVAKAISHRLTENTLFTGTGELIGTPEYMSPEQANAGLGGIDTRSDVYSLGVMLYELLAGALPFDPTELRREGYERILQIIREEDPKRPSTRVTTLGAGCALVARHRRVDLRTLQRQLKGDLDWITMKALEKDRARRYDSPSALAADLRRHLRHEPVQAGPVSAGYRARKFVRRHRGGVAASGTVTAALLALVLTIALNASRIARERDAAELARADLQTVVDFQTGMLSDLDPTIIGQRLMKDLERRIREGELIPGSSANEREALALSFESAVEAVNSTDVARRILDEEILAQAAEEVDRRFADRPLIAARLYRAIGRSYLGLGLYDPAEGLLLKALSERERILGAENRQTLESGLDLCALYWQQGHPAETDTLAGELLETMARVLGRDDPLTISSMEILALSYAYQGRLEEAEPLLLDALETRERVLGPRDGTTLNAKTNVGLVYLWKGRYEECESILSEVVAETKRYLGDGDPSTLLSMNLLGGVYVELGRYEQAESVYVRIIEKRSLILGEEHPRTVTTIGNLAGLYARQKRYDEAENLYRRSLKGLRRTLGSGHINLFVARGGLATVLVDQGKYSEAENLYLENLEMAKSTFGPTHLRTAEALYELSCLEAHRGNRAGTLRRLEQAVDAGFSDYESLGEEPLLEFLQEDPEYNQLQARVRRNADSGSGS